MSSALLLAFSTHPAFTRLRHVSIELRYDGSGRLRRGVGLLRVQWHRRGAYHRTRPSGEPLPLLGRLRSACTCTLNAEADQLPDEVPHPASFSGSDASADEHRSNGRSNWSTNRCAHTCPHSWPDCFADGPAQLSTNVTANFSAHRCPNGRANGKSYSNTL